MAKRFAMVPVVLLREERQLVTLHGIPAQIQAPLIEAKAPMPRSVIPTEPMQMTRMDFSTALSSGCAANDEPGKPPTQLVPSRSVGIISRESGG
jgi:hypothetical protein